MILRWLRYLDHILTFRTLSEGILYDYLPICSDQTKKKLKRRYSKSYSISLVINTIEDILDSLFLFSRELKGYAAIILDSLENFASATSILKTTITVSWKLSPCCSVNQTARFQTHCLENYHHVVHKLYHKLTKPLFRCLWSKDQVQIRNALIDCDTPPLVL
jgi:hypothetical protein